MSERLFSLENISVASRKAHVSAWVNACAHDGVVWQGKPHELQDLSAAIDHGHLPADELVGADDYWIIRNTRGWKKKFYSVLSPPGDEGVKGTRAWDELRTPSRRHELRLLQIGSNDDAQYLATFLTQEGIYLLCPKTGLFYWRVDQSRDQFEEHMGKHYADQTSDEFRAWIVPLPTLVHVTWIGPPSPIRGQLPNNAELRDHRKDVTAAQRLSQVLRHHLIFFHCLKRHKDEFVNLFPPATYPNVRVMAIENQLEAAGDRSLNLTAPDLSNLERSVGYVVRESISRQRPSGPRRDLVNAKNIWSLYVIWRYGGYHLDSGVFPHGDNTTLPDPEEFGLARNRRQSGSGAGQQGHSNAGRELRLVALRHGTEQPFNAVLADQNSVYKSLVFPSQLEFKPTLQSRFAVDLVSGYEIRQKIPNADVDVWLMGSNPMNPIVRRAMRFYVQQWFLLQRMRDEKTVGNKVMLDEQLYGDACRAAIISAVYTGMAPVDNDRSFWGGPWDFFDRFGYDFTDRIVTDFGLIKVFYGTH